MSDTADKVIRNEEVKSLIKLGLSMEEICSTVPPSQVRDQTLAIMLIATRQSIEAIYDHLGLTNP